MSMAPRRSLRLAALALVWVLALSARPARAQIGDEDEPETPNQATNGQNFQMNEANFDAWVFNGQQPAGGGREFFAAQLKFEFEELGRICQLNKDQEAKLRLAAAGDLKRFFVLYDAKKEAFLAVRNDPQKFGEFYSQLQPLIQKSQRGLFGPGSLFAKSTRATLTPEQAARLDVVLRERDAFRYRAQVELAIGMLSGPLGLTDEQGRRFAELLLAEPAPGRRITQNSLSVVMFRASKLDQAKLRPIFDEAQWRAVKAQMNRAEQMEAMLIAEGALDPIVAAPSPKGGAR